MTFAKAAAEFLAEEQERADRRRRLRNLLLMGGLTVTAGGLGMYALMNDRIGQVFGEGFQALQNRVRAAVGGQESGFVRGPVPAAAPYLGAAAGVHHGVSRSLANSADSDLNRRVRAADAARDMIDRGRPTTGTVGGRPVTNFVTGDRIAAIPESARSLPESQRQHFERLQALRDTVRGDLTIGNRNLTPLQLSRVLSTLETQSTPGLTADRAGGGTGRVRLDGQTIAEVPAVRGKKGGRSATMSNAEALRARLAREAQGAVGAHRELQRMAGDRPVGQNRLARSARAGARGGLFGGAGYLGGKALEHGSGLFASPEGDEIGLGERLFVGHWRDKGD